MFAGAQRKDRTSGCRPSTDKPRSPQSWRGRHHPHNSQSRPCAVGEIFGAHGRIPLALRCRSCFSFMRRLSATEMYSAERLHLQSCSQPQVLIIPTQRRGGDRWKGLWGKGAWQEPWQVDLGPQTNHHACSLQVCLHSSPDLELGDLNSHDVVKS